MMAPRRYPRHVEEGLDLFIEQYKRKPYIEAWTRSYLKAIQELDDAIHTTIIARWIAFAVGAQQDMIGRIVGEPRKGRSDAVYKIFLLARVFINRSRGRTQDVLDVLFLIAPIDLWFAEFFPASLFIELEEEPPHDPVLILTMLRDTKAAGVGLVLIAPTTDEDHRFLWGGVGEADVGDNGFGDVNNPGEVFGLLSDAVSMRAVV